MCGIAGIVGKDARSRMEVMLKTLKHRGPDGEGFFSPYETIALGHTRLAINDLSENGKQPMLSQDQKIAVIVNGEIYNYPLLKKELEALGASFQSHSDSEVVLHAYQYWGIDCLKKLNGMFALGILDIEKETLMIARDRVGIKPLYYHVSHDDFIFSSEIKAIQKVLRISKEIDKVGLLQYLTYQNTFGEQTLFSDSHALKPGHFLIFKPNESVRQKPYWTLAFSDTPSYDFNESVSTFRELFSNAVERHLMSDVDIACYLSSGFDSASVTAKAAMLGKKPIAYTAAFAKKEAWYDETIVAAEIAKTYCRDHIKVQISPFDLPEHLDDIVWALDEPKMGMSSFPQYLLAREVRKNHKVVLTGHGGDELFSGYPVFKLIFLMGLFKNDKKEFYRSLSSIKKTEIPHLGYFLLNAWFNSNAQPSLPVLNHPKDLMKGLKREWQIDLDFKSQAFLSHSQKGSYENIYQTYFHHYLPGLLTVEDKLSMAHGLESRTPFLDNELLDFSLQQSEQVKLHQGELKALVKEGAKAWLPESIYRAPKRGFPTPLRYWLRDELKDWMTHRITGSNSALHELFEASWLKKVSHQYLKTFKKNIRPLDEIPTHRMWQLLCLESWLRQSGFSKNSPP